MLWWCQDNPDSDWESFSTPLIKRFKNSYGSHIFKRLTAMKQEVQTKMESSSKEMETLTVFLKERTNDPDYLKCFLGIGVIQSEEAVNILLTYALNILEETKAGKL